jgi:hypothetical protein
MVSSYARKRWSRFRNHLRVWNVFRSSLAWLHYMLATCKWPPRIRYSHIWQQTIYRLTIRMLDTIYKWVGRLKHVSTVCNWTAWCNVNEVMGVPSNIFIHMVIDRMRFTRDIRLFFQFLWRHYAVWLYIESLSRTLLSSIKLKPYGLKWVTFVYCCIKSH